MSMMSNGECLAESFDKDVFMRKILGKTDSDRLFLVKKKYSTCPSCITGRGCFSITNIIFGNEWMTPILTEEERGEILDHIRTYSIKTNKFHILTDVDDTILSSRLGGTNVTYLNHTVYPGVISFYENVVSTGFVTLLSARPDALSKSSRSAVAKNIKKPVDMLTGNIYDIVSHVVPITANSADRLSARLSSWHKLRPYVPYVPYVTAPSIATRGAEDNTDMSYPSLIENINGGQPIRWYLTYKDMGMTKFESILKYIQIYPEFKFIFIGDSGQGDLICAYQIYLMQLENPEFPVKASFIHNIIKPKELKHYHLKTSTSMNDLLMLNNKAFIKKLKERDIFIFNNYIDVAGYASCLRIINNTQLLNIIDETLFDFTTNKKQNIYYQEELYISYIEQDLLESAKRWRGTVE